MIANERSESMASRKGIEIPYNAAGQLAFDVFHRLAVKLCETADEATRDFMLTNFPTAETVSKEYVNRQYRRIIQFDGKQNIAVVYDFKTQTTAAIELSCAI